MQKVFEKCEPLFSDTTIFKNSKMKELDVEKKKVKYLSISNIISDIVLLYMGIRFLVNASSYSITWHINGWFLISLIFINCFSLSYGPVSKWLCRLKSKCAIAKANKNSLNTPHERYR